MQEPATGRFAYGGQAVMEGVMMRGRHEMAVAVRAPSGEILVWAEAVASTRLARRVRNWPFLRGAILLWDTLALGMRALVFSANIGVQDREPRGEAPDDQAAPAGLAGAALWGAVTVAVTFSIGVFFILPLAAVAMLDRFIGAAWVSNAVEGLIRLVLLLAYLGVIGLVPDVRRVFGYHGAEHKTIHAWEQDEPLDVAHVRRHPLEHPRCGTGFMLVVMLLAIAVFLLLGRPALLPRIASRILLVPVIAGIAYEYLKYTARHTESRPWRWLMLPSLKLQLVTTREPDAGMMEVAIAALQQVLIADGHLDEDDPRLCQARRVGSNGRPLVETPTPAFEPLAAD